ncbi:MAG: ABC transporter ATP-binding protein, partial [Chitinivibrionales bacterium]|nr:ABC transporter ATP-binding protein [Chitinivibrionales bacterium]
VEFITHDLGVISELADNIIVMYAGRVVEYGSNQEIFNNPVHPYTRGLLQSIPRFRNRLETLYAIPGVVPSPFELPQGCVFYNRCAEAKRQCQDGRPTLITIPGTENHTVACFHQDQQKV